MNTIIGTAGWSIPLKDREHFPAEGSSLERYATRFRGVEINSSFHRPHRASTWARWAQSVPEDFQFSVKLPKTITHQRKLVDCEGLVGDFIADVAPLGSKLAVLLVQLPPSLAFDPATASPFLAGLVATGRARVACEPRHPSWFEPDADKLLADFEVSRVAADPAILPAAAQPGGCAGLAYWRLHGSPRMYRSPYEDAQIAAYAGAIAGVASRGAECWCMFDNTAASLATGNALDLAARLSEPGAGAGD
jgi:uncharacterized protein YecE (DUF72 family)